jgi:flagellar biosynthesis anti-sigma factor FlgM
MQISNNFSVSSVDAARSTSRGAAAGASNVAADASAPSLTPVDQLDLSAEAQGVTETTDTGSEIRVDKVADLRRQIAEGTYDTDEKLSAALDNFLDQIG